MSSANRTLELLRVHVVPDEAEEIFEQATQNTVGGEILQALHREGYVDIEIGVIMRLFQLMDDQILVPGH